MKVTVMVAMTVDGKIGIHEDHFPDWTGNADKKLFKKLSMQAGVIIMGSKTFDTIGKPLPGRKNIIMTRNTARRSSWDNLVFSSKAPKKILNELNRDGYERVILAGGSKINSLFAKEGLIDELIITLTPKIFGKGISLFSEPIFMDLRLKEMKELEKDVIYVHYVVDRTRSA